MINSKHSNAYTLDDLLHFYKRIFGVFCSHRHIPRRIDQKFAKLSNFLNRNFLLFESTYLLIFAWSLYLCLCQSMFENISIDINIFLVLHLFSTSMAVISFLFRFEDVKKFWFELKYLDRLIVKRLKYTNNYLKFKRSFIYGPLLLPFFMLAISLAMSVARPLASNHKLAVSFRLVQFYIEIHVIFVIGLFRFLYKRFGKSITFACQSRRLNSNVANINHINAMIKHYKVVHYQFWIVSNRMNKVFGTSMISFSLQTFIEMTRFFCLLFYLWEVHRVYDNIKLTSWVWIILLFFSQLTKTPPHRFQIKRQTLFE